MSTSPIEPPSPPDGRSEATSFPSVVLEVLREMREQRQSFERSAALAAKERRSERRWRNLFQAMFFGAPVLLGVLYFLFFLSSTGFRWGPFGNVVGIVRIEGPIGSSERASAENIIPILEKAFGNPNVKGVVLHIDSPGGAPVEAERISTAINALKSKHRKEVVAVINNVGASAAYMIAMHTDKVYASQYSLVGSVGAVLSTWDLHEAIETYKVRQKVFASGPLKAMLNPFVEQTPEARAKAQSLVDIAGKHFGDELQRMRGSKLQAGVNYTSGAVWGGIEAQQMGLADELATLDEIAGNAGLTLKEYGPGRRTVTPFSFSTEYVRDWIQETLSAGVAAAMYAANTPKFN